MHATSQRQLLVHLFIIIVVWMLTESLRKPAFSLYRRRTSYHPFSLDCWRFVRPIQCFGGFIPSVWNNKRSTYHIYALSMLSKDQSNHADDDADMQKKERKSFVSSTSSETIARMIQKMTEVNIDNDGKIQTDDNNNQMNMMNSQELFTISNHIDLRHIQDHPISSTQDEARRLLHEKFTKKSKEEGGDIHKSSQIHDGSDEDKSNYLVVMADQQTNGRGTQGRKWESVTNNQTKEQRGNNLFITICIPMDHIPVMVTLLPLQIGIIVVQLIEKVIRSPICQYITNSTTTSAEDSTKNNSTMLLPRINVKWPNDILINDKKISGTLIENEIVNDTTWMLIGIGLNVAYTPSLNHSPGKQIRGACSIQDFCQSILPNTTTSNIGIDIANTFIHWIVTNQQYLNTKRNRNDFDYYEWIDNKRQFETEIVNKWREYAQWNQSYELRGNHVDVEHGGYNGELVKTIDIQYDGQLVVRDAQGRQRLLIADYMY